jgi:hypothetical protein
MGYLSEGGVGLMPMKKKNNNNDNNNNNNKISVFPVSISPPILHTQTLI